jgi:hypothetical protein
MDVHPPKNGIFIGIDPYPHGINIHMSIHHLPTPSASWKRPPLAISVTKDTTELLLFTCTALFKMGDSTKKRREFFGIYS